MEKFPLIINGFSTKTSETFDVKNPSTGEIVGYAGFDGFIPIDRIVSP